VLSRLDAGDHGPKMGFSTSIAQADCAYLGGGVEYSPVTSVNILAPSRAKLGIRLN
jgi:hypothetical protein